MNNIDETINKAHELYEQGEYHNAIELYSQIVKTTNDIEALSFRATCYMIINDLENAINDFSLLIKLDSNPHWYNNRGQMYSESQEYDKAINDFENAIKLDDSYSHSYINLSRVYMQKQDYEKALKILQKAMDTIQKEEDIDFIKLEIARVYNQENQPNKAISIYDEFISKYPKEAIGYTYRAISYVISKNYSHSIKDCESSLKLDNSNSLTYYTYACALSLNNSDINKICEALKIAIELYPEYKIQAQNDKDFDSIRNTKEFICLVS
jgi:tetratricopeptide (TPR) repeat protein